MPATILLSLVGASELLLFAVSALAIVPLAGRISGATEDLACRLGPGVGGLLNATFGNATELIIGLFGLKAGLFQVVKASISGSIISNVLLIAGLAMAVGGWGREKQRFSATRTGASAGMLFLAVVALIMPALFDLVVFGTLRRRGPTIDQLSLLVCVVLVLTYLASLVFSLKTHRGVLTSVPLPSHRPRAPVWRPLLLLAAATVATAYEADVLIGAVSGATRALGMTEFFVGVIVVAIVGNAAEHYSAVVAARRDEMDLALTIALSSGTQIALFVAPLLVFASRLFGTPMSLVFNPFEIMGITLSVIVLAVVALDGESNWFEGVQLLAVYLVLAIVFLFVPAPS